MRSLDWPLASSPPPCGWFNRRLCLPTFIFIFILCLWIIESLSQIHKRNEMLIRPNKRYIFRNRDFADVGFACLRLTKCKTNPIATTNGFFSNLVFFHPVQKDKEYRKKNVYQWERRRRRRFAKYKYYSHDLIFWIANHMLSVFENQYAWILLKCKALWMVVLILNKHGFIKNRNHVKLVGNPTGEYDTLTQ